MKSLTEFYSKVETLIQSLQLGNFAPFAGRLRDAIDAGSMASEILGLLSLELKALIAANPDDTTKARAKELLEAIRADFKR